jgi:hypothetical protein
MKTPQLNWIMLAGLGVVGVGLYLVAPNLVAAALPFLALAVCPLAMLLMMRGMHESQGETHGQQAPPETDADLTREEQITRLRRQQAALADRIDALERDEPGPNGSRRRTVDTEGGIRNG